MNFLLKLILFLLIPQFLFAGDYFNSGNFAVYSWGDSKSLENAFQSVSLIIQDNQFMDNIRYIAVFVSAILSARFLIEENVKSAFAEIAYVIGILTFVYGSTATVHIIDKRVNSLDYATVRTVSGVPWMLGFTAHTGSIFVQFIVDEIDAASATTLPNFSYTRTGFMKAFKIMKSQVLLTQNYSNSDTRYRVINNYYSKCIMRYSLDIPAAKFASLANPPKYIAKVLDPNYLGLNTKAYDNTSTCGTYYTTGEGNVTGVVAALTSLGNNITKDSIKNNNTKEDANLKKEMLSLIAPTNKLSSVEQASSNLIAAQIYENSSALAGVGVAGIDIANKASAQASKLSLIQNGSGKFAWMADMLPKAMHILTIIIVMAFLPMGIVVAALGMQKGLKNLMNYFFGFIAFQSLSIALAIVQSVVNGYAVQDSLSKLVALGTTPMTAVNIPYYITYLSDMIGLSGMLGVLAIPLVISIMYKGETAMAGGIATGVGGAYKSLGTRGTQEELNKNFSTNLAERNQAAHMNQEERASRILGSMGIPIPTSGTAVMALAEVEQGIEKVNRANAASHALTGDGGLEKLNAGAGVRAENEMSSKMAYGEQAVRINGGEVRAISLASGAGAVDGAKAFGAIEGKGVAAEGIDASGRSSVALAHSAGAVEGIREMHSIAGAGQAGVKEGIINNDGSINTSSKGYSGLTTATEANSMKDLASIVKQGEEINGQKNGMHNFIEAGRLKAINDTQSEMSTGKYGNEDDYRSVAQQNAEIAAKNISDIASTRKALTGKNSTEKWSADKVAMGQAISSVHKELEAQGVSNALTKEGQPFDDAIRQTMKGSELKGRISENSLLGTGKKWAEITKAGGDLDMMKKVQDNAVLKEIGGITSAHKAIEAAGGSVDKAMDVANTLAAAKAGSDVESIDRAGSAKEYIARMKRQGRNKMSDMMATQDQYIEAYNEKQSVKEKLHKGSGKFYNPNNPTKNQGELDDFIKRTEFNKATVKNAIPEMMTTFGDYSGYALEAIVANRLLGNPIQKGGKFIASKSPFLNKNTREKEPNNTSNNNHNTESDETFNNEHKNTPKENYKMAQRNVSSSRQSLEDYNEKLTQEQGRKNPNAKKMSEFQNGISQAEREMEVNKQLAKESKFKMDHPFATKVDSLTESGERIAKGGFSALKSGVKSGAWGIAIDATVGEASQYALDHGNFKTANALTATGDVISGVYGTILGTGATALGYATGSSTIKNFGTQTLNSAGQSIADAVVHTEAVVNGDHNVFRKTQGGNTAFGEMLGYGSASQHSQAAYNAITSSYGPQGGGGQVPGSSSYQTQATAQAPTYAQTAFTTPPGYNTQQAMQGNMGGFNNGFITTREGGYSGASGGYMADSVVRQTTASEIHYGKMEKVAVENSTTSYMQNKEMLDIMKAENEAKMNDMLVGGGK